MVQNTDNGDRSVIVFGGGGHSLSVLEVLSRSGYKIEAVVDPKGFEHIAYNEVRSDEEGIQLACRKGAVASLAIGDATIRKAIFERVSDVGVLLPPVVASSATIARDAALGAATIVFEHSHVGPRTRAGLGCIINTGAVVEHEVYIGDWTLIGPGAVIAGGASCGSYSTIGANATVLPGRSVGSHCIVGAGAVVTDDVPDGQTVFGIPARARLHN